MTGNSFTVNHTGLALLRLIQQTLDMEQITKRLQAEFVIDASVAERDASDARRERFRRSVEGELPMNTKPLTVAIILHAAQFSVFENSWNFSVIKVCILPLKRVPRSRRQASMLSLNVANLS